MNAVLEASTAASNPGTESRDCRAGPQESLPLGLSEPTGPERFPPPAPRVLSLRSLFDAGAIARGPEKQSKCVSVLGRALAHFVLGISAGPGSPGEARERFRRGRGWPPMSSTPGHAAGQCKI